MSRKRVIIEISPSTIDAAVLSGTRAERTARVDLTTDLWSKAWDGACERLDAPIQSIVHQLRAKGLVADVCYVSPTSVAEVISIPAKPAAAWGAARLALADLVTFDLLENPWAVHPLAYDAGGEPRRSHMLAVADEAARPAALSALLERAGLRVGVFAPVAAATLAHAVESASHEASPTPVATLRLGTHVSALAVSAGGRLRFVRRIEIGVETITEALTHPMVRSDDEGRPFSLNIDEARRLLFRVGVPEFKEVVDEERGLSGRDVLPLLQPVLQRLVVEVKQSLRFELSAQEREASALLLCGRGAAVPRLAEMLAGQIEIDLHDSSGSPKINPSAPFHSDAERPARLAEIAHRIAVVHQGLRDSRLRSGVVRGMRIGVGVAAALMLGAGTLMRFATESAEQQARRHAAVMEKAASLDTMRRLADAHAAALTSLRARAASAMGMTPSWPAWLIELAQLAPESMELESHTGVRSATGCRVELTGAVRAGGEKQATEELTRFIDALKASPLVASVELGATRRLEKDGVEELRFSAGVNLTFLPRVVALAEEGTP